MAACMKLGSGRPGISARKANGTSRKNGSQTSRKADFNPRRWMASTDSSSATKTT